MNVPRPVDFPEYTNAAINAALLADKLNEVLIFLREKYPDAKPDNAWDNTLESKPLKEGIRILANGRYMLNGKFVKKEDAYA